MKKLLIILSVSAFLIGCAFIQEKKLDAQACLKDVACFAEATAKAKDLGIKAGDIASLSGVPAAASVAKPVVGYAALIIFLCSLGAALRKKEPK